jgi:hypothetical protein
MYCYLDVLVGLLRSKCPPRPTTDQDYLSKSRQIWLTFDGDASFS